MSLEYFEACRFRNFSHLQITPAAHLNVIYGDNGSGKTSLIEAIYSTARLRSFRSADVRLLIANGEENFLCRAKIRSANDQPHHVGIQRSRSAVIVKLDGQPLRKSSELAKLFPLQIINNDVHLLIEGGPGQRRQYLDWGVFHVEPSYGDTIKTFRHLLKQRNAALREHRLRGQLKHWDVQLTSCASRINVMRQHYLDLLQPVLEELLSDSFNLPQPSMHYFQGWASDHSYEEVLEQSLEYDQRNGKTHYGPHRADLRLRNEGRAIKEVVSRGQQKILATIMMLAQVELYKQHSGRNLTLLIDDLPAELDRHFVHYFLNKVIATDSQIFITTTDPVALKIPETVQSLKMFHVEHGTIAEV